MANSFCLKKLDLLCWCMFEAAKYLQLCLDVCLAPMFLVDQLDGTEWHLHDVSAAQVCKVRAKQTLEFAGDAGQIVTRDCKLEAVQ